MLTGFIVTVKIEILMKLKIIASKKLKIEYIVMILSVLVIGILA